jgi:hypothetical protein
MHVLFEGVPFPEILLFVCTEHDSLLIFIYPLFFLLHAAHWLAVTVEAGIMIVIVATDRSKPDRLERLYSHSQTF